MISLLVVNYRSAALAAEAIRTARASTTQSLQIVVVDNSCDTAEAEALRGVADTLIAADTNRGYAGGINLGRPACTGDTIIVSNPDVTFAPQSIDHLHEALRDASVAGPAFFWDEGHRWMLPPGDLNTAPEKLDEVLASRSLAWARQRDRRRFRNRVAFWSQQQTTETRMLSGAVMAIRAADFDRAEGFDEPAENRQRAALNWVSPNYFATYGTPILAGRDFRDADMEQPRRVIVNQAVARRYFAGRDAVGRRLWLENERDPYEIVGVAGDAKYSDIHVEARAMV